MSSNLRPMGQPKGKSEYGRVKYAQQPRSMYRLDTTPSLRQSTTNVDPLMSQRTDEEDNFDRVAKLARDAYSMGKEILGELNVEDKIWQIAPINLITADWVGVINSRPILNSIPQSVNEAGRTGDSIKMKGINIMMNFRSRQVTWGPNESYEFRVAVVYHPAGATITKHFPDALGDLDGLYERGVGATNWVANILATRAPRDYDSLDKAKVLHEFHVKLKADNNAQWHDFYVELNRKTQFENDSSVINSGTLQMFITTSFAVTAITPEITWASRLYFVDN